MPTLTEHDMQRIAFSILHAAGAPEAHAKTVSDHLSLANLSGHDSHGFIRIMQYIRDIKNGGVVPDANPETVLDFQAIAQLDGKKSFGQVAMTAATKLAIEKARKFGIGMITVKNLGHTGRIGTYNEMIARENMVGLVCTGFAGASQGIVSPFGGKTGKLGTNPISYTFPSDEEGPILLDMATNVGAEGKLRVYRARGHDLPDKWVLDSEGNPSENPNDFYEGGAILPVGGLAGGHKGFGLGMVATILGAVMAETGDDSEGTGSIYDGGDGGINGSTVIAINAEALGPIDETKKRISNFVKFLKDVEPMDGSEGVLYPGEVEIRNRVNKRASGVEIEDATWNQVCELIDEYNVRAELEPLPN